MAPSDVQPTHATTTNTTSTNILRLLIEARLYDRAHIGTYECRQ